MRVFIVIGYVYQGPSEADYTWVEDYGYFTIKEAEEAMKKLNENPGKHKYGTPRYQIQEIIMKGSPVKST